MRRTNTVKAAYTIRATAHRKHVRIMTATTAALFCANVAAKVAYNKQGVNGKRLTAISAAISSGDMETYRKLTAQGVNTANGENGLYSIRAAIKKACGVNKRGKKWDGDTRMRLVYDALSNDTSTSACEMFGQAYTALYEMRGHDRPARLTDAEFLAACHACHKVLNDRRAQRARNVGAVDTVMTDANGAEYIGYIAVPKYVDVHNALELMDLQADVNRTLAACSDRKAERTLWNLLGGLSQAEIARRLGVSRAAITYVMRDLRQAYDKTHGTVNGKRVTE